MSKLSFFMNIYFAESELDDAIDECKRKEDAASLKQLVRECDDVIKTGKYAELITFLHEHCYSKLKPRFAELFIKYLRNRLTDTPTEMTPFILYNIKT